MMRTNVIFLVGLVALLAGCAAGPEPQWMEAADVGVLPVTQTKPGVARATARNVAIKHAEEKLFQDLLPIEVVKGFTIRNLAAMDPVFYSKLISMIQKAKTEEEPNQARGLVIMKVRIDKTKVLELAQERMKKDPDLQKLLAASPAEPPAADTTPQPTPAPSSQQTGEKTTPAPAVSAPSSAPIATEESPQKTQ